MSVPGTEPVAAPVATAGGERRARRRESRALRAVAAAAIALPAGLLVPAWLDDYYLGIAVDGAVLGILAVAIGFLVERLGLVSLGHTAFYGAAAYGVAIAATELGWSLTAATLGALVAGTLLSVLIGALVVRTPGMGFVMLTLAFGQALHELVQQPSVRPVTGAHDGLSVDADGSLLGHDLADLGQATVFWPIAWTSLVVAVLVLALIGQSRFGRLLEAIRENEERVRFSGYGTFLPRLAAFALTGVVASLAGVLLALHNAFVSPDLMSFETAGNALIAAIVGGAGLAGGPALGGFGFVFAQDRFSESGNLTLYTGIALIVVLVFARGGIAGLGLGLRDALARRRTER